MKVLSPAEIQGMRTACKVPPSEATPILFFFFNPLSHCQWAKHALSSITQYTREVLDVAAAAVKPGVTGDEIDRIVHEASLGTFVASSSARLIGMPTWQAYPVCSYLSLFPQACIERNCYPSPLNYVNFPKSCCISVNEVICHGIPDKRELEDGDICNGQLRVTSASSQHALPFQSTSVCTTMVTMVTPTRPFLWVKVWMMHRVVL